MTKRALLVLIMTWLVGCSVFDVPQPVLGDRVVPPVGYILHCIDYPESVFCVRD
jgi:hypothetical protein